MPNDLNPLIAAAEYNLRKDGDLVTIVVATSPDSTRMVTIPYMGRPGTSERFRIFYTLGKNLQSLPNLEEVILVADAWVAEIDKDDRQITEMAREYAGKVADLPNASEAINISCLDSQGNWRGYVRKYTRDVSLEETTIHFKPPTYDGPHIKSPILVAVWSGYRGDTLEEASEQVNKMLATLTSPEGEQS